MGTPKKPVEQRREEIIPALLSLVQEQGQKGLSVSAVARRIGLVPSAIYRHFKDRDAMIEGVAEYVATRLAENAAAAAGDGRTAEEKLRRLLDRHIAMIRSNPGLLRIVFSDELFGGKPSRRALMLRVIQGYLDSVARLVREGQDAGEFSAEVDSEMAALNFFGLIQPLAVLWHLSDGGVDITRMADRSWKLFRRVLAPEQAIKERPST
jgi:AcrR family transcriptional regulator